MRYLVTGGAGFIGSHLVDRIVASGADVTILDNFASGTPMNIAGALATGKARLVEGSILNEADIAAAMDGVDGVFHLAVECIRKSLGDPLSNHAINATGTLMVLEAARKAQVKRFIYCSSSEVYGNASSGTLSEDETVCAPTTVYGGAKLAGELYALAYLRTYGMAVSVVRPFNAYGPREHDQGVLAEVIPRFVIRVLNGRPPVIFGDGRQGRDFTYVTDIANAIWAMAMSDQTVGETINIGWGRLVSIRDVAQNILQLCGRNDLDVQFDDDRPGEIRSLIAHTRKAQALLKFTPETEFSQGLQKYIEWFSERHPDPSKLLEENIRNWTLPA